MSGIISEHIKIECQKMYVKENKNLAEIRCIKNIATNTLSRWKKKRNWEEKRKKYSSTIDDIRNMADEVMPDILNAIVSTKDLNMKAKLLDGLSEVMKTKKETGEYAEKKNVVFGIMNMFSSFVNNFENDKETNIKIQILIIKFLTMINEKY